MKATALFLVLGACAHGAKSVTTVDSFFLSPEIETYVDVTSSTISRDGTKCKVDASLFVEIKTALPKERVLDSGIRFKATVPAGVVTINKEGVLALDGYGTRMSKAKAAAIWTKIQEQCDR